MPGGRFVKGVSKPLPGTYINFESTRKNQIIVGMRGTVIIPLSNTDYGNAGEFIRISADSPDGQKALLGHSIYDDDPNRQMLLLREGLKRATTVYAYIMTGGETAKADVVMTLEEVEHSRASEEILGIIKEKVGVNPEQSGVVLGFNTRTNTATVSLTTNVLTQIKGTGLVTALQALNEAGYTVIKIDGEKLEGTDKMSLLSSPVAGKLSSITKGGPAISISVEIGKDEENLEPYTVLVDYPSKSPGKQGPLIDPKEGENTLKATAKSAGSRGNDLTVTVDANPVKGYDVLVHLAGDLVAEYDSLQTVEDLIEAECQYVTFEGTGELGAAAGTNLEGGTDKETTNEDVTKFIDNWETVHFDTVCFPFDGDKYTSLKAAAIAKIKFLREDIGRGVQVVIPNAGKADYEGVINVTNSVFIDEDELSVPEACAWVAGATAGANNVQSLTYNAYEGATKVSKPKTQEQAIIAVNNGEFFFTVSEQDEVVVMTDINSLVTFSNNKKDKTYRKNRIIRVFDTLQTEIQNRFAPNQFNNDSNGWDVMEGIGKTILQQFEDAGAIQNVNLDEDFKVDRTLSVDDETYFDVGIQAMDSAEKLYFTISTR